MSAAAAARCLRVEWQVARLESRDSKFESRELKVESREDISCVRNVPCARLAGERSTGWQDALGKTRARRALGARSDAKLRARISPVARHATCRRRPPRAANTINNGHACARHERALSCRRVVTKRDKLGQLELKLMDSFVRLFVVCCLLASHAQG